MLKKIVLVAVGLALAILVGYRVVQALKKDTPGTSGSAGASAGARPGGGGGGGGGRLGSGPRPTLTVTTAPVSRGMMKESILLLGDLLPAAQVAVMPKIGGRLQRLLVDRGDFVARGALIAQVEDQELQQQLQRAEATLGVARATLQQRRSELANFESQLARTRRLYDEKLISTQDLEEVQSRVRTGEAQRDLAEAQIQQAQASINELKINIANARILSPLSGFVAEKHVDRGAMLSPSTAIVTVLDLSSMKTVVNVTEKDIPKIRNGLGAQIEVDAYPGRSFRGRVNRISPMLDPATRTVPIEILVPNDAGILKSGMFARVELSLNRQIEALVIPRDALVTRGTRQGVFVARQGKVEFVELEAGLMQQDKVQVLSGLAEGDLVVARGAQSLSPGDSVKVVKDASGGR